jgi:hypothetical protein
MSPLGHAARKKETATRALLAALLLMVAVGVALHGVKEGAQRGQVQAAAPAASSRRRRARSSSPTSGQPVKP